MSRDCRRAILLERIKRVRALERELDQISNAKRNVSFIELTKPIRDGWFRTLRLRPDISRSEKAPIYQEALEAVVVDVWGRDKKYADRKWVKYFVGNNSRYLRPGIRRLDTNAYKKLSVKAKKCFVKRVNKGRTRYSCILPRHFFIPAYKRAYIDKYKIIPSELDRRKQEIMEILERQTLRPHSKFFNYKYRFYINPKKKERRKAKMQLVKLLEIRPSSVHI